MVGTQIGDYRVTRLLGEGGMGAVYEAQNMNIGGRVAIKVLHPQHARDQEQLQRFFNEARAVNLVEHPGLVKIFHFGQLANGSAYLVMEHLSGESLAARQRHGGLLPLFEAKKITQQIALTLAAAHARGIIHRDLKPSNVMLVPDPAMPGGERVKVLDFGIAKLPRDGAGSGPTATRTGTSMGTPEYMSPEQCQEAAQVNDRADVYSLGVMLFELLAGRLPFEAPNSYTLMYMHVSKPPPELSRLVDGIPETLSALVHRMLAKDTTERPTMADVAKTLTTAIEPPGWVPTPSAARSGAMRRWLILACGVLLLASFGWLWHLRVRQQKHISTSPPLLSGKNQVPPSVDPPRLDAPISPPAIPVSSPPPMPAEPSGKITSPLIESTASAPAPRNAAPIQPPTAKSGSHVPMPIKTLTHPTLVPHKPETPGSLPAAVPIQQTRELSPRQNSQNKFKYDHDQLKD